VLSASIDVMSILAVEGLYDRKAVVVWPTDDFLSLPSDLNELRSVADMNQVDRIAMEAKGLIPPKGITLERFNELRVGIRGDHVALEKALCSGALTEAFNKLSKLILAVSGGQNLVVVLPEKTPIHNMCWTKFITKWTSGEAKSMRSYKSSDSGYGVLNSVKEWPLVFHGVQSGTVKAGELVPSNTFLYGGHSVNYDYYSYLGVELSRDVEMTISFPVTDRFSGARAIKVSGGGGYMLMVSPPDKGEHHIIQEALDMERLPTLAPLIAAISDKIKTMHIAIPREFGLVMRAMTLIALQRMGPYHRLFGLCLLIKKQATTIKKP
jgi:hypothetical protein